jgi:predicted RNA-binding Zn-ribbon protein involved in translation (DUF1610 family)
MKIMMIVAAALFVMAAALGQETKEEEAVVQLRAAQDTRAAQELKAARKGMAQREVEQALVLAHDRERKLSFLRMIGNVAEDVTVNLEIENATLKDALNALFKAAKREYAVEGELPGDARVSLKAMNVKLGTALDLITQAAGVGWTQEKKEGKTVYRIGKNLKRDGTGLNLLFTTPEVRGLRTEPVLPGVKLDWKADTPLIYSLSTTERMSTFTCPHCHGKVTVMRSATQPRCPKCGRVFQADWQFCPADGTKRPASPGAFKFCPLCGKPIEVEKSGERK